MQSTSGIEDGVIPSGTKIIRIRSLPVLYNA